MIHQYELFGRRIVLDAYSGSVHCVDPVAYDMIAGFETREKEELLSALLEKYGGEPDVDREELDRVYGEIEALRVRGKLFSEDPYPALSPDRLNRGDEVKALCLHVAHTCNFSCEYCFAGQGRYHGDRALMSFETGRQAIDFLAAHSGKRRNLEVDFFGGEPLLNFGVVKEITAYARSVEKERGKNFRFTLTTNGLGLDDEVIEFANRECHNVVLSLDGRREVHDRFRKLPDGRGTYDLVVPKFRDLVERRGGRGYYLRGTFTRANTDFMNDILHMLDLGFTELSMEPVVCAPGEPYALREEDLPVLFDQYERLARELIRRRREGRPFTFYHYMIDLAGGPCIYKRVAGCGSGTEYLAVTPEGALYPCHQFVGDGRYLMGDVWQGVTNPALREAFGRCNAWSRQGCADCWARLWCGGGCAANAYHAAGDISGVYEYGCALFKKRLECALMVKAMEALEEQAPGDDPVFRG